MTESQIGEYTEYININLNKIKRQVNQIEPGGGNSERFAIITRLLNDIAKTITIMDLEEYKEELKKEKKNK